MDLREDQEEEEGSNDDCDKDNPSSVVVEWAVVVVWVPIVARG